MSQPTLPLGPAASGVTVALSPGARATGVAALGPGGTLRRFALISSAGQGDLTPAEILSEILDVEAPCAVLLESLSGSRSTPAALAAAKDAEAVLDAWQGPWRTASLPAARSQVVAGEPPTRLAVHERLAARYPQLADRTRGAASRAYSRLDAYWERAFAALTLALAHVERRPAPCGAPAAA